MLPLVQEGDGAAGGSAGPTVDLSSGLTGEALQPILSKPEFLEKVNLVLV